MGDGLINIRMLDLQESQRASADAIHVVLTTFSFSKHVEKIVWVFPEPVDPAALLFCILVFVNVMLKFGDQHFLKNVSKEIVKLASFMRLRRKCTSKTADNICPDVL